MHPPWQRTMMVVSVALVAVIAAGTRVGSNQSAGASLANLFGHRSPLGRGTLSPALFDTIARSGHRIGPSRPLVTIVVFGTYGCGFCGVFSKTLDSLRDRFPQQVAVVSHSYLPALTKSSITWHLGAECAADQGRFATYHRLLFSHLMMAELSSGAMQLADSADVPDLAAFYGCMQTQADLPRVTADTRLGQRLGVEATPTFVVNGSVFRGTRTLHQLTEFVHAVLGDGAAASESRADARTANASAHTASR